MNIPLNSQVTATYARNHFKEVNDKAVKEGRCFIVRDSKPVTVILSVNEYENMTKNPDTFFKRSTRPKITKKVTLEELRKDNSFDKFGNAEKFKAKFGNIDAVTLAKKWTDYVD